jgi:hypothetical protein
MDLALVALNTTIHTGIRTITMAIRRTTAADTADSTVAAIID